MICPLSQDALRSQNRAITQQKTARAGGTRTVKSGKATDVCRMHRTGMHSGPVSLEEGQCLVNFSVAPLNSAMTSSARALMMPKASSFAVFAISVTSLTSVIAFSMAVFRVS